MLLSPCTRHRLLKPTLRGNIRLYSSPSWDQNKPYYLTTPIFYPNSVPHIGHLYTLVITDIISRYARLSWPERPVSFLTGTDEHGLKIQKAAEAQNLEPREFCDQISHRFRDLADTANTSYTRFIRTSEKDHHYAVQHVWRALDSRGLIYKGLHKGWYSISDECFYTDNQIERLKSPHGAPNGTEKEIVVSKETGSVVEWTEEENYKFRLSRFHVIHPPQQHANIVDVLSMPLEDLSVSRPRNRLHWGIPVPNDASHTVYVWFDALINYLTGAGYPWVSKEQKTHSYWPPDLQVVGKDIIRFHAIYFPAMLQALDLPLPKRLLAHCHWTVSRRKMSKSIGNVVDPFEAMQDLGTDLVRYYLARIGGRFKDDVEHLREVTNPLRHLASVVDHHLKELRISEALEAIIHQLKAANIMVSKTEPWAKNTPEAVTGEVYALSLETLRICGILLQPFIPAKAGMLLDVMGISRSERALQHAQYLRSSVGNVTPGVKLFSRVSKKVI
ncbi:tRNA synthetases class I (M)-domain-containing protein [Russula earlei]|uniref:tRNA synthetases class I (M)-domain-containing protein n=1 Tax=Russula earlei TaxID=71964 RepID=A0ACC0UPI4_9AGAM|nr:tRNA synthetases class I (M)-domain-containing protein [Russula earlei]